MKKPFPFKKCIIASIIIIIVYVIILSLLINFANNITDERYTFLIPLIWAICLSLSLIVYWVYQIIMYKKYGKK